MYGMEKIKLITPLSHGLPKTGQEVSYIGYDDGYFEDGWWFNKDNANNRRRFIEKEFVSGENVIIDLATGLMWPKSGLSEVCSFGSKVSWTNAHVEPTGTTFSGYSDWRCPNIRELLSICNQSIIDPAIHSVFTDTQTDNFYSYWSSTSYKRLTTSAWYVRFNDGWMLSMDKSNILYIRPVRRFA